uniref:ATP-binding cassette domain-containing protein n=1 Tax=Yoonia sp. TaxID=2212373 RepID=UPI0040473E39
MALQNPRGPFAVLMHKKTAKNAARIEQVADEIGLLDSLSRAAGELSHGQKQWLEIGMLLAQDPRLLLVDEPPIGPLNGVETKIDCGRAAACEPA